MSGVRIVKDDVEKVFSRIRDLTKIAVLVGIPEQNNERDNPPGTEIGNAAAGYLSEFGHPATNLPARPFLIPGVKSAEGDASAAFKKGAIAAMSGDHSAVDTQLTRAGMAAVSAVRKAIKDGDFTPLSPYTIANRWRKRHGVQGAAQSMRKSEKLYLQMLADGVSPEEAQIAMGIKPLINTAQMLKSITFVLRRK